MDSAWAGTAERALRVEIDSNLTLLPDKNILEITVAWFRSARVDDSDRFYAPWDVSEQNGLRAVAVRSGENGLAHPVGVPSTRKMRIE